MGLFSNKQYDIVAIGDIVTDAFIRLKDATTHCKLDQTNCELCVRFGDKVPFESSTIVRAVGNSANAAVSAARLGLSTALMSVVGDDTEGKACLQTLKGNNVGTTYMGTDPKLPTNYHYVLWYDVERTILVKHSSFERHLPKNLAVPKWIYLTSLGENTENFHHEISTWLKEHPQTKLVFQPGTFQIKLGKQKLADVYTNTEIFFCNVEEAGRILNTTENNPNLSDTSSVETKKTLLNMLADLGPKIVVMTDGINGAYARDKDGSCYFMPVYPHDPFERTGAGDAFASTVMSALALGKDLKTALTWAPINSMSVVQYIGAQEGLLSREKLETYLKDAPSDYRLKEI